MWSSNNLASPHKRKKDWKGPRMEQFCYHCIRHSAKFCKNIKIFWVCQKAWCKIFRSIFMWSLAKKNHFQFMVTTQVLTWPLCEHCYSDRRQHDASLVKNMRKPNWSFFALVMQNRDQAARTWQHQLGNFFLSKDPTKINLIFCIKVS